MTIRAIGQDDRNCSLNTVVKSTAAGTAGGYAMKWLWPLSKSEKSIEGRVIINYSNKVINKRRVKEYQSLEKMTPAQDAFVKMINDEKKGLIKNNKGKEISPFTSAYINNVVENLGGENSTAGKEFRNIIRNVNEDAKMMRKRLGVAHNIMLKYIRPAIPFLVVGAGVGFFSGIAHNVMKCDYCA